VILDRDPLQSTPDQLRDANVIATYIDGRLVDVSNVDVVWRD
jgi:predicted amidohydrolase YtcJ